jgi:hypothetical protein
MVSYLKNFLVKLLLLPVFALLGVLFLLLFLIAPQFKLFRDAKKIRPWSFTKSNQYESRPRQEISREVS